MSTPLIPIQTTPITSIITITANPRSQTQTRPLTGILSLGAHQSKWPAPVEAQWKSSLPPSMSMTTVPMIEQPTDRSGSPNGSHSPMAKAMHMDKDQSKHRKHLHRDRRILIAKAMGCASKRSWLSQCWLVSAPIVTIAIMSMTTSIHATITGSCQAWMPCGCHLELGSLLALLLVALVLMLMQAKLL